MITPGVFIMAIRTRLLHAMPNVAVIAALGYDDRIRAAIDRALSQTEEPLRNLGAAAPR